MLDPDILSQVKQIFAALEHHFTFAITRHPQHESAEEMTDFMHDVASCSDHLECTIESTDEPTLSVALLREGQPTGIVFRAIPNGHEFTSLLLAVLNADGKGKNLPDEGIVSRIKALEGPAHITSYVSLTCTICPDVVQALNIMTLLNPQLTHEMVDIALFEEEAKSHRVQGVPTVYANGQLLHVGRSSMGGLLQKLEETFGSQPDEGDAITSVERQYDLLVVGAGPAGAASAIYSARKGLRVAVVCGRVGGQVKDTVGIENVISVPYTTGSQLAVDLRKHMDAYHIDVFEERNVVEVALDDKLKRLVTDGGETFVAPAVIIATGANWRRLNVPGEAEHIGRGVAFCPHCDGPMFKGKHVAVVGGGNSGIEAAIDLAGICSRVTVLEFLDVLKADGVLQQKAKEMQNIEIRTSVQTTQVVGDGQSVSALKVKDRNTGNETELALDGVFVQIGLAANSGPFGKVLETTRAGEIVVDRNCRTAIPGVYAAGDVSNVAYKQIIIAMGEGAKAALSAFDDRVKGVI